MKNMFCSTEKSSCGTRLLMIWGIIALIYIVVDVKSTFENREMAFNEGAQAGITQLVTQAMDLADKCETIPLVMGEKTVDLINTACLTASQEVQE